MKSKFKLFYGTFIATFLGVVIAVFFLGGYTYVKNLIFSKIYAYKISNDNYSEEMFELDLGAPRISAEEFKKRNVEPEKNYYKIDQDIKFPRLSSTAYLVADIETGEIIEEKNSDKVYAIASVSKLMTALVALETTVLDQRIVINREAIETLGNQGGFQVGQIVTLENLLHSVILSSSNDATEAIADYSGRNFFLDNMNKKADVLGMKDTEYDDPSGLSSNNVSTAKDLFKLVRYIESNYRQIFDISMETIYRGEKHTWYNNNPFAGERNYRGGKNGYTWAAKHTLVTTFNMPLEIDGSNRKIAIIILQSDDVKEDTNKVLYYLLKNVYFSK